MTTVVGIDPSLTSTGIAIITALGDQLETWTGNVTSSGHTNDTWQTRADRLTHLRNNVMTTIPRHTTLAVIEGPAFGAKSQRGNHDRSWYWGKLYDALHTLGIPTVVCPPTTRAKYATDRGNGGKPDVAMAITKLWPDITIRGDDQADALCLASIGAQHLKMPVPYRVLDRHKLAIAKLDWPTDTVGESPRTSNELLRGATS